MRVLAIVAIVIALMTMPAQAQMGMGKEDQTGMDKGKRPPQRPRPPGEHPVKADENAYKDALKRIPQSHEKHDPWKSVR